MVGVARLTLLEPTLAGVPTLATVPRAEPDWRGVSRTNLRATIRKINAKPALRTNAQVPPLPSKDKSLSEAPRDPRTFELESPFAANAETAPAAIPMAAALTNMIDRNFRLMASTPFSVPNR
jgi:hypothetical protein